MFNVSGKHAIVTGGAQGLSRGMAEGLLENGCKVVLVDIQKEKLEAVCEEYRAMGYEAYEVCGNLSDRADVDRIFTEAMEILDGKLDVLIPAAGVQRRHLPEEFPIEEWDLVLNINLNAVFLMIQKALKVMLKQAAGGKIITIGSMVTWFGGTRCRLIRHLRRGIPVNQELGGRLCGAQYQYQLHLPGIYGYRNVREHDPGAEGRVHRAYTCRPWGTPEDLKGPVLFLASSASDYLNGTTIPVDGGYLVK